MRHPVIYGCSSEDRRMSERATVYWREVRRASIQTNSILTSRLSWALIIAALGPMIGAAFATAPGNAWRIVGAGLLATAALLLVGLPFIGWQLWRYRRSGYRNQSWVAEHDDSGDVLFLF